MKKESLNNISSDKLVKRKKQTEVVMVIMYATLTLTLTAFIYDLVTDKIINYQLLFFSLMSLFFAIFFQNGRKKTITELARRDTKEK